MYICVYTNTNAHTLYTRVHILSVIKCMVGMPALHAIHRHVRVHTRGMEVGRGVGKKVGFLVFKCAFKCYKEYPTFVTRVTV